MKKLLISFTAFILLNNSSAFSQENSLLKTINEKAIETHSSSLVIYKDGKLLSEYYSKNKSGKIETMSVTKSIVNLAIGKLITDKLLKSIDEPVYKFYPEWNQGRKKLITIKHLLNHTSGIQNEPSTAKEIYPSYNFVQLALAAELSDNPGKKFSYNNKAVNLLSGIVERISGQRMDKYIGEKIFKPIGISDFSWTLDKSGTPHAMSGLQIYPKDLTKLGLLMINNGKWENKHIIDKSWIDESIIKNIDSDNMCGLLWWLIPDSVSYVIDDEKIEKLKNAGSSDDFIKKVTEMKGKYISSDELTKKAIDIFGNEWQKEISLIRTQTGITLTKKEFKKINGYYAEGYLGQYLVVYPDKKIVGVRMIESENYVSGKDSFYDFINMIQDL